MSKFPDGFIFLPSEFQHNLTRVPKKSKTSKTEDSDSTDEETLANLPQRKTKQRRKSKRQKKSTKIFGDVLQFDDDDEEDLSLSSSEEDNDICSGCKESFDNSSVTAKCSNTDCNKKAHLVCAQAAKRPSTSCWTCHSCSTSVFKLKRRKTSSVVSEPIKMSLVQDVDVANVKVENIKEEKQDVANLEPERKPILQDVKPAEIKRKLVTSDMQQLPKIVPNSIRSTSIFREQNPKKKKKQTEPRGASRKPYQRKSTASAKPYPRKAASSVTSKMVFNQALKTEQKFTVPKLEDNGGVADVDDDDVEILDESGPQVDSSDSKSALTPLSSSSTKEDSIQIDDDNDDDDDIVCLTEPSTPKKEEPSASNESPIRPNSGKKLPIVSPRRSNLEMSLYQKRIIDTMKASQRNQNCENSEMTTMSGAQNSELATLSEAEPGFADPILDGVGINVLEASDHQKGGDDKVVENAEVDQAAPSNVCSNPPAQKSSDNRRIVKVRMNEEEIAALKSLSFEILEDDA